MEADMRHYSEVCTGHKDEKFRGCEIEMEVVGKGGFKEIL